MMADHKTEQEFYIVGAFDNKGGIMKPYRVTGQISWYATFNYLDRINAQVINDQTYHVIGCGSYLNGAINQAGVLRMSNDGHLQWFYKMVDAGGKSVSCYGITNDATTNLNYLYIISDATSLSMGQKDASILVMDNVGTIKKGSIISMGGTVSSSNTATNIDFRLYNQFLIPTNNFTQFYFGGQVTQFTTTLQTAIFNSASAKRNVFVMKYQLENKPN
jgi:hypothetical protein